MPVFVDDTGLESISGTDYWMGGHYWVAQSSGADCGVQEVVIAL